VFFWIQSMTDCASQRIRFLPEQFPFSQSSEGRIATFIGALEHHIVLREKALTEASSTYSCDAKMHAVGQTSLRRFQCAAGGKMREMPSGNRIMSKALLREKTNQKQ
jgi:hypothetical protein